jgi:hypothetical protein
MKYVNRCHSLVQPFLYSFTLYCDARKGPLSVEQIQRRVTFYTARSIVEARRKVSAPFD